jgi:ABC-type xylose transport system substrate-binding protein
VLAVKDKGKSHIGGADNDNNARLLKEGTMNILQPKIDSVILNCS